MATREQIDFIDERFNQLIGLSKDAVERAMSPLFFANAGGAASTLSFPGTVPAMRTQWAAKTALGFFVVGLILVGVHTAIWIHYSDALYRNFYRDVTRFYQNQITFDAMTAEDFTRSQKTAWLWYAAFVCLIAGAAVGLLYTSFY